MVSGKEAIIAVAIGAVSTVIGLLIAKKANLL